MKTKKKRLLLPLFVLSILAVLAAIYWGGPRLIPSGWFGFAYEVPANEAQARMELVEEPAAEEADFEAPVEEVVVEAAPVEEGTPVAEETDFAE